MLFNANYGQHIAIIAGFERCRGERIVTLDADLQNPPEEIGKLLAAMDAGHDYVGGVRRQREDSWWRRAASRAMNRLRQRLTRITMTDQGCMLRAYSREIVAAVAASQEVSTFIPALAYTFAASPTEVEVAHEERAAGESKYSLYKLIRLNFDLVTGFSLVPLQLFSMFGMLVSALSLATYLVVIGYRVFFAEWRGAVNALWDRDILAFFLIGAMLFGLGLIGEYVGRIYLQVRERPRYTVRAVLSASGDAAVPPDDATRRRWTCAGHDPRRRLRLPRGGRALPQGPARARHRCAAGRHPRGQPERGDLVRLGRRNRCRVRHPRSARPPTRIRRNCRGNRRTRAGFPVLVLLPPDAEGAAARAGAARAHSTCTARCCQNTADARRSTGRCSMASARPARRCTT